MIVDVAVAYPSFSVTKPFRPSFGLIREI